MELTRDGKEVAFIWVPGQTDIRENLHADFAARAAFDGDILEELIPVSDLWPCVNICFEPKQNCQSSQNGTSILTTS